MDEDRSLTRFLILDVLPTILEFYGIGASGDSGRWLIRAERNAANSMATSPVLAAE